MSEERGLRPPLVCLWLMRMASWLAPRVARVEWRARWISRLWNLWVLVERGELASGAGAPTVLLCRDAMVSAFWLRFNRAGLRDWVRGPGFVVALTVAGALLLAVLSHGFEVTRSVLEAARGLEQQPARNLHYDPRADLVVGHMVPIVLALAIGVVLVIIGRLSLGRYNWRYWLFLVAKTVSVMVLVPLLWVEGGAAVRAHIPHPTLSVLIGGLGVMLTFLAGFGWSVVWVFADQRSRCPVCLRRLALPVTIGSWASVFEPATTEFLCDEGHGSLCISESGNGQPDRWIGLDASWRGL